MQLKEAQDLLPSACPSSRFPARRLTRSHGLPGSRGLTTWPRVTAPGEGPRRRVGRCWREQAIPALLCLTDLGWALRSLGGWCP